MSLVYGGFGFTNTSYIGAGVGRFIHDRSFFLRIWVWASHQGDGFSDWLKQPRR
jgi:hypothetical protein